MPIDLSSLHPAFQAAFLPLIVSAASADEPEEEQEEEPRAWDDPIDDSDAQHDMRRDWKLDNVDWEAKGKP